MHVVSSRHYPLPRHAYDQVLAINKNVTHGKDNVEQADILANIGRVYKKLGDYATAEENHRRALDIARRKLGHEHYKVDWRGVDSHLSFLRSRRGLIVLALSR